MGKALIVKGADFSAVKVKAWEEIYLDTINLPGNIVSRTGDLLSLDSISFGSVLVAVPSGATKYRIVSAYLDRAPSQCGCFNSSTPSSASFLGFSDDHAYEDSDRGPEYLGVTCELLAGTTYVVFTVRGNYDELQGANSLPMTVAFK